MVIKRVLFVLLLFSLLFAIPLASAQLKIEKTFIADSIIPELNNSAVVDFSITNLGASDEFKIYSLVGAYFNPSDYFAIANSETKEIRIEVRLSQFVLDQGEVFNFKYRIEGKNTSYQEDEMAIVVAKLNKAIEINAYNINLNSEEAIVYAKNLVDYDFPNIKADFHSAFFDFSQTFSLDKHQKKEFSIPLNSEVIKKLIAGDYSITTNIEVLGLKTTVEDSFKFTEKAEITTKEDKSGFIIRTDTIQKINDGNLPFAVQIKINKNIISRLFTTFNIEPSSVERNGFSVVYTFQKELQPSESLIVKSTTNWLYPLILIVFLIVIGYLVNLYVSSDVVLKKRASFVKTKGGEFALKVSISVKAKKYIEKINIIDRLPPMVKLFDKYSSIHPSRVDEHNKRIEWNISSLQQYEERVVSYIIFSKIGVIGKFELPPAAAIYERDEKTHETTSNKVFFMTETPKSV